MGQDSKRKRLLRRVKRERTQLRQAIAYQQNQLNTVVKMLMETQAELRALKPVPSYTIETVADDAPTAGYRDIPFDGENNPSLDSTLAQLVSTLSEGETVGHRETVELKRWEADAVEETHDTAADASNPS